MVEGTPERAFEIFTEQIGQWWPRPYTFAEDRFETAAIEARFGGRWFERSIDGTETAWGEVRAYEKPSRLVLSWAISPARTPEPPDKASEVEIRFEPADAGTRVWLEHRAFERHGAGGRELREGMESSQGWALILASYARAVREHAG